MKDRGSYLYTDPLNVGHIDIFALILVATNYP